jgi:demethylmenaquinone methyltransferase/2-methoxy-6-polyprenyl-1,4-benzoquinol methylase
MVDERRTQDYGRWVRALFDRTARDYEWIERCVGFGAGSWYRNDTLRRGGLRSGMDVLDVGLGTGLLAREAVRLVGDPLRVVGLDPSTGMLCAGHITPGIHLIIGCVERLPLAAGSFDFVSMGYVLRYLRGVPGAFAELYRVLRPGGRVCILELSRPGNRMARLAWGVHIRGLLPVLARLGARGPETPHMVRYLWETIEESIAPAAVVRALEDCGFAAVEHQVDLGIFSAYLGQKPAHRARAA